MRPGLRILLGALTALLLVGLPPARLSAQVAVIVNPANADEALSADRLRRLFLGQVTTFAGGGHARLATHTGSAEKFDRAALGLPPEPVRARWMAMTFRGEVTTLPAEYASAADVKRFVAEHADAVAYIPAAEVDASVKVLKLDGKRPGDPGYLLR
ncbi:MAG: phosphate transporter substrate-binding protein [Gemmatimonadetes bacterium]|nr:phosphate transporter substrate-binding protein [Gemmatimonadota bacterium]